MRRSWITEDQVPDVDFASELEMGEYLSTVSGSFFLLMPIYLIL